MAVTPPDQAASGMGIEEARPTIEPFHYFGAVMISIVLVGAAVTIAGRSVTVATVLGASLVVGGVLVGATRVLPRRFGHGLARSLELLGGGLFVAAFYLWLLTPGIGAYLLSKVIVDKLPYGLQMLTLLLWLAGLGFASVLMYSRKLRARVKAWWETTGPRALQVTRPGVEVPMAGAIALYMNFVFVAMGGFAAFALILNDPANPIYLPGSRQDVDHGALADFFGWHLLDAIPVVKATETLQWEVPLTYTGPVASWLLLAFKVMVIVPAIRGIGRYLKDDDKPEAKAD